MLDELATSAIVQNAYTKGLAAFAGIHGFFGSDAWSSFGVQAVEWAIGRILSPSHGSVPVVRSVRAEDTSNVQQNASNKQQL